MTLEMKELEIRMEAEARGEARGKAEGRLSTYIDLVRDSLITKQEAARRLSMSEEEFERKLTESV